jgi:hypothetical protein
MKKRLFIFIPIVCILAAIAGLLLFLSITEYKPKSVEALDLKITGGRLLNAGQPLRLISWNLGYASLGENADFFMDGGKTVRAASMKIIQDNLEGMRDTLSNAAADIQLLQEVDVRAHRSYYIDQTAYLAEGMSASRAFAPNFRCAFVPIPFPSFIGGVDSGLLTITAFAPALAERHALPIPFKWPVRIANLKRCLLVERIPIAADTEASLVLVNLHLEAYDSSGGREAQTAALMALLKAEYERGSYCIAGGDFNQTFPGVDMERFPVKDKKHFIPGSLSPDLLPEGWQFAVDLDAPSSRLLNEPYSGSYDTTQLYLIDGFIISPNVELISVKTLEADFKYTDHNPVLLEVVLTPAR